MKNRTPLIVLFSVLGALLLGYFILSGKGEKKYQWKENYQTDSDQPYGTLFMKELLAEYRPGEKFILNEKKPLHVLLDSVRDTTATMDYVFVGQEIYLDEADKKALLSFIHTGNDAFIASVHMPFILTDSIYTTECDNQIFLTQHEATTAKLNFYHPRLQTKYGYAYSFRYKQNDQPYFWNTLNPEVFCDSTKSLIPLGYVQPDRVNFFKIPFGKGNLYLHTTPLVFTNYFLTQTDKVNYAATVFSHLRGKTILWDEFSKAEFTPSNNAPPESPISYILQHPSLKYAWWMMLGSALLYTIFTAKRKQRVIPILEKKTNTSLEYVNMVSALHFQNGNNHDIAKKKMKYFLYFIRAKYGIHAQSFTENHLKRLSEKSAVAQEDLQIIFTEHAAIERYASYASDRLVILYNALDKFYKNCK